MADIQREIKRLCNFEHLSKPEQRHLKNVYATLAMALIVAAAGAYVHLFTNIMQAGLLTMLGSLGLLVGLSLTPHSPENIGKRMGFLMGFAFCSGMALGPLMEMVIMINPSIIPTAFMGTSLIFVCFSLSALFTQRRQFLFLGGMLFSGLSFMMMLSLLNLFMQSRLLYDVNVYFGFIVMCGFVLYDTQLICEKRKMGDDDFIWHCLDLFIDFISLFRRLMIILANKEDNKKRRN